MYMYVSGDVSGAVHYQDGVGDKVVVGLWHMRRQKPIRQRGVVLLFYSSALRNCLVFGRPNQVSLTVRPTEWPKNFCTIILCALILPNINRFSKLFHYQNQEKIGNNTITKDPTTPQVCRYTTL